MKNDNLLKAVIIDDEPGSVEALKWELEPYAEKVQVIAAFTNPAKAAKALPDLDPDVVFLDIEMPGMNGFDLLKSLDATPFAVIFTTAYDQFAIKAFKVNAIDYLVKPIDEDELKSAIEKAMERKETPATQNQLEALFEYLQTHRKDFPTIALPTMEGLEFVELEDIVHCESSSNYTYINLANGEQLLVSKTLKEVESMLTGHHFCRVHHSHVINLKYAKRYLKGKGGTLILKNGKSIPVSRTKKEDLLRLF